MFDRANNALMRQYHLLALVVSVENVAAPVSPRNDALETGRGVWLAAGAKSARAAFGMYPLEDLRLVIDCVATVGTSANNVRAISCVTANGPAATKGNW